MGKHREFYPPRQIEFKRAASAGVPRLKLPQFSQQTQTRTLCYVPRVSSNRIAAFCLAGLSSRMLTGQVTSAPIGEIGVDYSYNQLDTFGSNVPHESGGSVYGEFLSRPSPSRLLRGMSTIGLVAEFSGSGAASGRFYSYLAGLRFNNEWHKSHLNAWAEFALAGAHASVNQPPVAGSGSLISRNGVNIAVADGVDLVLKQRYMVHLFQVEFVFVKLPAIPPGSGNGGADLRISGGFGYRFHER